MSHRVTRFPFNIMTDPMYNGSTMCFLGTALWYAKPAGIWLTGLVWVVYQVALGFEG
jgi:phosphatidylethanolamine N-methyltransferase